MKKPVLDFGYTKSGRKVFFSEQEKEAFAGLFTAEEIRMYKTNPLKNKRKRNFPSRTSEAPVNQEMLTGVRDELKSSFKSLEKRVDSRFTDTNGKIQALEQRIDSKIQVLEYKMESHFEDLKAMYHRLTVLVEEQNYRNSTVYDSHIGLSRRQDEVEDKVDSFERTLLNLKKFTGPRK